MLLLPSQLCSDVRSGLAGGGALFRGAGVKAMSCPVLASSRTAAHKAYACVCIRYRRYLRYYTYGTTDRYTILMPSPVFRRSVLEFGNAIDQSREIFLAERSSKAQQNGFLRDFFDLCCAIKLRNRPAKISGNAAATTLTSALTQRSDFL